LGIHYEASTAVPNTPNGIQVEKVKYKHFSFVESFLVNVTCSFNVYPFSVFNWLLTLDIIEIYWMRAKWVLIQTGKLLCKRRKSIIISD
jgi:hypothetical protein